MVTQLCFAEINTHNQLSQKYSNFNDYVTAAQNQADQNHPENALTYFQEALSAAQKNNNPTQIRTANFGIAKIKLWLGKYADAELVYKILYQQNLSQEDKEIALDGLLRSLNYQDKSREAYTYLPANMEIHNTSLMIAIAETYTAQGKMDNADVFLKKYASSLKQIPENSSLDTQFKKINANIAASKASKIKKETVIKTKPMPAAGSLAEMVNQAREQINKNNGKKAFELISPYLENNRAPGSLCLGSKI